MIQKAFKLLIDSFNERQVRYAIIGGIAVIQHGRPRTTEDIDVLLVVPQIGMPGLFEALQAHGFTVDVMRNTKQLRDDGMTAIRFDTVVVDLMRPITPTYNHVLDAAIDADVLGQKSRVVSAEGLIVTKLIAYRPQDMSDIREVIGGYANELDVDFIRKELESFTNPDDPRRADFEKWFAEARSG